MFMFKGPLPFKAQVSGNRNRKSVTRELETPILYTPSPMSVSNDLLSNHLPGLNEMLVLNHENLTDIDVKNTLKASVGQ